jgi:hypothetical protein
LIDCIIDLCKLDCLSSSLSNVFNYLEWCPSTLITDLLRNPPEWVEIKLFLNLQLIPCYPTTLIKIYTHSFVYGWGLYHLLAFHIDKTFSIKRSVLI